MGSDGEPRQFTDYDKLLQNFEQGTELQALRAQLQKSQASLRNSTGVLAGEMRKGME